MSDLRPGTKIKFWNPGFRNRPDVQPPGLLLLVSVLALLSSVGLLVFAVADSLSTAGSSAFDAEEALYIAVLHFVLPLTIAYTISTNSPLSKPLILAYILVLFAATMMGIGYLGELEFQGELKAVVATAIFLVVLLWLVGSPKMRLYYVLLSGKPVPEDLQHRVHELSGKSWLGPKARQTLDWVADNLETIVLLGFIVVVLYAFHLTGSRE